MTVHEHSCAVYLLDAVRAVCRNDAKSRDLITYASMLYSDRSEELRRIVRRLSDALDRKDLASEERAIREELR